MPKYKFDGQKLKKGSSVIATIRSDKICKGSSSLIICNIKGERIRKGNGSSVDFNVRGDAIRKGTGSSILYKMKGVDKDIDGSGQVVKAALWLYFVR